jgi:hypothetical protein
VTVFQLLFGVMAIGIVAAISAAGMHVSDGLFDRTVDKIDAIDFVQKAQQIQFEVFAEGNDPVPVPRAAASGALWQLDNAGVAIQLDPKRAEGVCRELGKMGVPCVDDYAVFPLNS